MSRNDLKDLIVLVLDNCNWNHTQDSREAVAEHFFLWFITVRQDHFADRGEVSCGTNVNLLTLIVKLVAYLQNLSECVHETMRFRVEGLVSLF